MSESQLAKLRSVFGPFSQSPPNQSRRVTDRQPYTDPVLMPEVLPAAPQLHEKTNVVLVPTKRIDGSLVDAPWNMAEPTAWNWLRTVPIEHIEERVLDGTGGAFWARCRNNDGELRSVLLRFDTVGQDGLYETWGAEYSLSIENHDVLRREQAAYEAAKSIGCEDIAPPIAARQTNLVPLISDAVRELIAAKYEIDPLLVDESFGVIGMLQIVPLNAKNFVEYWGMLGPDFRNQFEVASDALRHGLYKTVAMDFILGTGNRMLSDLLHNEATDSVAVYGLGVTFPSPTATADRYLSERAQGWGRRIAGPTEDPTPGSPACGADTLWLPKHFGERERAECLQTFEQISKVSAETTVALTCQILEELGVQRDAIAGFVARMVFLQEDPNEVLSDPYDFVRSVLVPMRRGYGFDAGRNMKIVDTVNQIMTLAFGEQFDFAGIMQLPAQAFA